VPAQQRLGCDDPAAAEWARERRCVGAEETAVVIVDVGPVDLASQHLKLVAEHNDLKVLGVPGTHGESGKCREKAVEEAKHGAPAWRGSRLISTYARISEPHSFGTGKPLICSFSDSDPVTGGVGEVCLTRVPGAQGQPHVTIRNAHRFFQEDAGRG